MARPKGSKNKTVEEKTIALPVKTDKVDLGKAIELRMKQLSYQEIANYFNVSKSAIVQRLQPFFNENVDVPAFKQFRAEILASKQAEVLMALTEDKLEKASARDIAITFGTLFDKERLERGQSTSNNSVFFRIIEDACHPEPTVINGQTTDTTEDDKE